MPVTLKVICGGRHHTVTASGGRLFLSAHPKREDLAELARQAVLVEFGGQRCPCQVFLKAALEGVNFGRDDVKKLFPLRAAFGVGVAKLQRRRARRRRGRLAPPGAVRPGTSVRKVLEAASHARTLCPAVRDAVLGELASRGLTCRLIDATSDEVWTIEIKAAGQPLYLQVERRSLYVVVRVRTLVHEGRLFTDLTTFRFVPANRKAPGNVVRAVLALADYCEAAVLERLYERGVRLSANRTAELGRGHCTACIRGGVLVHEVCVAGQTFLVHTPALAGEASRLVDELLAKLEKISGYSARLRERKENNA